MSRIKDKFLNGLDFKFEIFSSFLIDIILDALIGHGEKHTEIKCLSKYYKR